MDNLKIKNIEDILLNSSATELVLINDQTYFTTSDKNKVIFFLHFFLILNTKLLFLVNTRPNLKTDSKLSKRRRIVF